MGLAQNLHFINNQELYSHACMQKTFRVYGSSIATLNVFYMHDYSYTAIASEYLCKVSVLVLVLVRY